MLFWDLVRHGAVRGAIARRKNGALEAADTGMEKETLLHKKGTPLPARSTASCMPSGTAQSILSKVNN